MDESFSRKVKENENYENPMQDSNEGEDNLCKKKSSEGAVLKESSPPVADSAEGKIFVNERCNFKEVPLPCSKLPKPQNLEEFLSERTGDTILPHSDNVLTITRMTTNSDELVSENIPGSKHDTLKRNLMCVIENKKDAAFKKLKKSDNNEIGNSYTKDSPSSSDTMKFIADYASPHKFCIDDEKIQANDIEEQESEESAEVSPVVEESDKNLSSFAVEEIEDEIEVVYDSRSRESFGSPCILRSFSVHRELEVVDWENIKAACNFYFGPLTSSASPPTSSYQQGRGVEQSTSIPVITLDENSVEEVFCRFGNTIAPPINMHNISGRSVPFGYSACHVEEGMHRLINTPSDGNIFDDENDNIVDVAQRLLYNVINIIVSAASYTAHEVSNECNISNTTVDVAQSPFYCETGDTLSDALYTSRKEPENESEDGKCELD